MLKHAVKLDSVVKFSDVASCACCLCRDARLGTGQRATKGWHTAGYQQITPSGFGTTLLDLDVDDGQL
jgi:hypothetical protein